MGKVTLSLMRDPKSVGAFFISTNLPSYPGAIKPCNLGWELYWYVGEHINSSVLFPPENLVGVFPTKEAALLAAEILAS